MGTTIHKTPRIEMVDALRGFAVMGILCDLLFPQSLLQRHLQLVARYCICIRYGDVNAP